jgi:hypothetical protein
MAGGSSRRARRRRRHARWGKPVYRPKPQTRGLTADLVIVDEVAWEDVADGIAAEYGHHDGDD